MRFLSLRGVALMRDRNSRMVSAASERRGRTFTPRSSDVFIVTYPKCGTTWMTQIAHGLRSGGDMKFGEITEVVPWDTLALDCGQDLDADHAFHPRLFKSHEPWQCIAKGGRYVYVARNPADALLSFYKFLPKWMCVPDGQISIEEFTDSIFAGASNAGQIWHHFLSFWQQRDNDNVLWLFFEDLKKDLRTGVKRVAKFMGMRPDSVAFDKALKQATYKFMSENEHQFDDHFVFDSVKANIGIQFYTYRASKVRKGGGKVGQGKVALPDDIRKRLEDKWATVFESKTGIRDYQALRAAYAKCKPEYYDDAKLNAFFDVKSS